MEDHKKRKAVAIWLIAGVAMIIIQTLLGGITRLTGSGLSITDWKPILGAIPPLNEQEWNHAFAGYKQIGQYKMLNSHFTLSDFKFIFFWEWFHRLWARLLGVVFIIGFIVFYKKQYFDKAMIKPFIILFVLGAAQGLIGWIMVKSGLNADNLYVNPIKLSVHFISAMVLACYTLWFALKLLIADNQRVADTYGATFTIAILMLLFFQLVYGAFMAGAKAALAAPTWPTINGAWLPRQLSEESWIHNTINIHFIHRNTAYLLLVLLILWGWSLLKKYRISHNTLLRKCVVTSMLLVLLQVGLGIFSVLNSAHITLGQFGTYELFAELHQMVAMLLLMSLLVNLYLLQKTN